MVQEACEIQFDRPKNLEGVALPRRGYFRLNSYSSPCLIERGVLTEARFVLKEEGRPFTLGFFLILGYFIRIQRSCADLSA